MKVPNTKLQHPEKRQASNFKRMRTGVWRLVFGISLVLGAWMLELFFL
jgi:hypothetical protein